MTSIIMILKSGGIYVPGHVTRLAKQVRAHAPSSTEIICLTDLEVTHGPDQVIMLKHGWPGWWSKIEGYYLHGPAVMMDLGVTITGDLGPLLDAAGRHEMIATRDFWHPDIHVINSAVMAWRADASSVYWDFLQGPTEFKLAYSTLQKWGDQAFVRDFWTGEFGYWDDLVPGGVLSFKRGCLRGADMSNCRVVVSHGSPKPWAYDGADSWLAARLAA